MHVRKIQAQLVYGAPSDRVYYKLRLPLNMVRQYVEEYGEDRHIWVESADTLCIGGERDDALPIHILSVRELRKGRPVWRYYWQVLLPPALAKNMRKGDDVKITRDNDTIRLKFGHDAFDAVHGQTKTTARTGKPAVRNC
ncbi:MAG: hypothetical protein IS632_09330 [Thaumarchaeota archaeon]|nr:hypothetical protein [Nitrososphaerota archaeon]